MVRTAFELGVFATGLCRCRYIHSLHLLQCHGVQRLQRQARDGRQL